MGRKGIALLSMLVAGLILVGGVPPVHVAAADATFVVSSTLDLADDAPGDGVCQAAEDVCTLRAAVQEANATAGFDTIVVPAGTYLLTIEGTGDDAAASGDLDITDDVAIAGDGAAATVIDGNALDRVFHVLTAGVVSISGVTAQGGYAGYGGGIANEAGQLTLDDVTIQNNEGEEGGGIWNAGWLTLTSSRILGNEASSGSGGGILNSSGAVNLANVLIDDNDAYVEGGGIISFGGEVTLVGGTVSGNSALFASGGGIIGYSASISLADVAVISNDAFGAAFGGPNAVAGGVGVTDGALTIRDSRIEDNFVYGSGGGIFVERSTFMLDGGVVSGNTARFGGGIYGSGAISNIAITSNYVEATLGEGGSGGGIHGGGTLVNVTISGNVVESGDGTARGTAIYGSGELVNVTIADNSTTTVFDPNAAQASPIYATGPMALANTIVSDTSLLGCAGTPVTSLGHNLDQGTTCGFTAPGDQSGVDPLLGPLADNGGLSPTHALLSGSPAIDAGDNGRCPVVDQRGQPRPFDGNGDGAAVCDIGAYESQEVVTPVDTTPPVIAPVSDLYVTATGRSGAKVVYTAPAYADDLSGSGTAICTPPSGTRFKLGETIVTCVATDDAGNTAEVSFRVFVTYSWSGLLPPINPDGSTVRKAGSMLPVKFRLTGASAGVKNATATLTVERLSDGSRVVNAARFSYNGQYMYLWKTKGLSPGEYRLTVNLGDGDTTRAVIVTLR